MSEIEYRVMKYSDIDSVLSFRKNINGVHLHRAARKPMTQFPVICREIPI